MKPFYLIVLFLSAISILGACQAMIKDLHPLTLELITSGIQFDLENNGRLGFNTYAASPESKAFAASVSKTGHLYAWGKG